jgi:hypothetical protein
MMDAGQKSHSIATELVQGGLEGIVEMAAAGNTQI